MKNNSKRSKIEYNKRYENIRKNNAIKHKKRRRRKLATLYIFLIISILLISCFFIIHSFFKVTNIEVKGSKRYKQSQIRQISNIKLEQNMFTFKSETVSKRLKNELLYVDEATVNKKLPNKVYISIIDAKPKYLLKNQSKYFVVSQRFKILETKNKKDHNSDELIEVEGIEISDLEVGKFISEDDLKITILKKLNLSLNRNKFEGINKIDIRNKSNIKIMYQNRIKILLGDMSQLDYKIKFVKHIVNKNIDKNEKGTIDATSVISSSKVYFDPYKEPIQNIESSNPIDDNKQVKSEDMAVDEVGR